MKIAPENRRMLKVRIGMNPDYGGHGIMFGSMVFVPYAVVRTFLVNVRLSPSLDEALKKYGQRSSFRPSPSSLSRGILGPFLGGFFRCLGLFHVEHGWAVSPYSLGPLSAAGSLAISYLAYRVTDEPSVPALTVRAAKLSLLPLSLGVLLAWTYRVRGLDLPGVIYSCQRSA
ncbi:MAG: hypothetical protein IMW97_02115 [Firmicutes bacterium]|nr:hypothetical protein [Candidatus Fermentithermobacillaceae bacterium]